ncbi:hypothetical protein EYF80_052619 [Liparis tanakae]|uniref:Uncharacterized protein n=1 Tax=Liparis tanakae TaxID=230148 RepID=A0A4Z2F8J7_9TELE|nr:hypothetical protein EYF80_052619 [Liparis tanakae]
MNSMKCGVISGELVVGEKHGTVSFQGEKKKRGEMMEGRQKCGFEAPLSLQLFTGEEAGLSTPVAGLSFKPAAAPPPPQPVTGQPPRQRSALAGAFSMDKML